MPPPASMQRASGPISSASPRAPNAASQCAGSPRADRASFEPSGTCLPSAPMASRHAALSSRCRSSRTKTICRSIAARAAPRRGTIVASTETPGEASASKTPGSSGEIRPSAAATYVSRTIGSLSLSSTSTHANDCVRPRGPLCQKGGLAPTGPADRKTTGTALAPSSSSSMSLARGTVPPRPCGGRSFDSISSNAGPDPTNRSEPAGVTAGSFPLR